MYTFVDIPTSNLARQNAKKIISVGQFVKHVICHNWILWLNGCLHSCYFLWECIQRVVSLEIVCGKVLSSQETSALCTWHTYNSGQILLTRAHLQIWIKELFWGRWQTIQIEQMTRIFQGHKCVCVWIGSRRKYCSSHQISHNQKLLRIDFENEYICRRGICHGSHELRFCKITYSSGTIFKSLPKDFNLSV